MSSNTNNNTGNGDGRSLISFIPTRKIFETIMTGLLVAALGWAWTLESRLARLEEKQNVVQRVENLENLLQPVLIEYRMREKLKEMGIDTDFAGGDRTEVSNETESGTSDSTDNEGVMEKVLLLLEQLSEGDMSMAETQPALDTVDDGIMYDEEPYYEESVIPTPEPTPTPKSQTDIEQLRQSVLDSVDSDINKYRNGK